MNEVSNWTDEELQEFYDAWKIDGWYKCCDDSTCEQHDCDDLDVCIEIEYRLLERELIEIAD